MSDRITERAKGLAMRDEIPYNDQCRQIARVLFRMYASSGSLARLFNARHARGMETYGVSLSDAVLTEEECQLHLAEELADALKYAIKLDEIRKAAARAAKE